MTGGDGNSPGTVVEPGSTFSAWGTVEHRAGVITVGGDLDLASAPHLSAVIASMSGNVDTVMFDMAEVTFVDLAGLRPILTVTGTGVRAWIRTASQPVRRLLEVVRLERLLEGPVPSDTTDGPATR